MSLDRIVRVIAVMEGDSPPPTTFAVRSGPRIDIEEAAVSIVASSPRGAIRAMEAAIIRADLDADSGNVSAAARRLGIDRKALERRVRRLRSKP